MIALKEIKASINIEEYKVIPICEEMYSDSITPMILLKKLKSISKHVYLLESVEADRKWGRYTFLGYDPKMQVTCYNGLVTITKDGDTKTVKGNPRSYIREILNENKSPLLDGMPSFTGGLVGYFSYDYIKYSEPTLNLDGNDEEGFKDVDFMLFDKVIVFDHYKQKILIIVNISTKDIESSYKVALKEIVETKEVIKKTKDCKKELLKLTSEFQPLFKEEEFCQMVRRAKNHIKEGDIFQVVLSNRMEAQMEGSLLDAYRVLRTTNPSPYMFYFSGEDGEIIGASPETLVKLEKQQVYTYPLAGTRPRGKNEQEDIALEKELLADEKECSEHNMLVDLGRNDIGKISKMGTVEVEKYMEVERYSHVMHIGSTVKGEIRDDLDGIDAMDAILPAGTLSGAPKIRACEIINDLENNKRGIYGGAIGYIAFNGNLDTCIGIRLAFSKNNKVFVRSGAGIVMDSVPENEYKECIHKAKAVMKAIEIAQEENIDDFIN